MKKRIWAMALVVVLVLSLVPVSAAGSLQEEEGAQWITVEGIEGGKILFNSETGAIEDCEVTVTSADIPDIIEGTDVKSIGTRAFEECVALKTVHIPSSVTSIESAAFWECINLNSIDISANISNLSPYMFYGCEKLTNVITPESISSIGGERLSWLHQSYEL